MPGDLSPCRVPGGDAPRRRPAGGLPRAGRRAARPPRRPARRPAARSPRVAARSAASRWPTILDDYESVVQPRNTHWNHPGFLAYFAITGSAPGIVGETLAAGLNVNAMLWRTGPAATELEERSCDWLRQLLGLPAGFRGHINDTASVSSFLALAAARERLGLEVRERGLAGRREVPPLRVYASRARPLLDRQVADRPGPRAGAACAACRPTRASASIPAALAAAIARDRAAGRRPMAVVATVGTTSTTSVDPVAAVAEIAAPRGRLAPRRRRLRRPGGASARSCATTSRAGSAPTRSSSTRTSGCSCRWTARCS